MNNYYRKANFEYKYMFKKKWIILNGTSIKIKSKSTHCKFAMILKK